MNSQRFTLKSGHGRTAMARDGPGPKHTAAAFGSLWEVMGPLDSSDAPCLAGAPGESPHVLQV